MCEGVGTPQAWLEERSRRPEPAKLFDTLLSYRDV